MSAVILWNSKPSWGLAFWSSQNSHKTLVTFKTNKQPLHLVMKEKPTLRAGGRRRKAEEITQRQQPLHLPCSVNTTPHGEQDCGFYQKQVKWPGSRLLSGHGDVVLIFKYALINKWKSAEWEPRELVAPFTHKWEIMLNVADSLYSHPYVSLHVESAFLRGQSAYIHMLTHSLLSLGLPSHRTSRSIYHQLSHDFCSTTLAFK